MAQEVLLGGGPTRVKIRSPWGVLGLTLITLGIYQIFWWYYINRELHEYGRATGYDLGQNPTNSLLALFPGGLIIVPALITLVRGTKRVQAAQRVASGQSSLNGWVALVLYLVMSILFAVYLQSELNRVWRTVGVPLPGGATLGGVDELPPRIGEF